MKTIKNLLAAASLMAVASCTGDFKPGTDPMGADGGAQGTGNARQIFDDGVNDLLQQRCSSCHIDGTDPANALKFMGPSGTSDYYSAVTSYPSVMGGWQPGLATVLTKQAHSGSTWWTPDEAAVISQWIAAEGQARQTSNPDPIVEDSTAALAQWSACMTYEDWQATDMGSWADKQAEGTACSGCHGDGLKRFNTNNDDLEMFNMNRYELFIIGFFTVKMELDGSAHVIPANDKMEVIGNGSTLHPTFNYDPQDSDHMVRLENFYQLTKARLDSGACPPAGFPPIP